METDIKTLLKKYRNRWKDTETVDRSLLPEGRYQWKVGEPKGGLVTEDSDGRVRARVTLTVVAGPEKTEKRTATKSWGLFTEDQEPDEIGFSILKSELKQLGFDVDELDLDKVPEVLKELAAGSIVDGAIRHKEDASGVMRQNIYLNGLARSGDVKETGSGRRRSKR